MPKLIARNLLLNFNQCVCTVLTPIPVGSFNLRFKILRELRAFILKENLLRVSSLE